MEEIRFRCRIEEVPFFSVMVRDYFVRDREAFINFSPVFDGHFLEEYDKQSETVKELVTPTVLTGEMKKITVRIGEHYNTARTIINKVEFYVKKAGKALNVKPTDFGFKAIRKEINNKDDEAIIKGFRDLVKHIDNNHEPLEEAGLIPEFREEIAAFIATFEKDGLDQNRKLAEREALVQQNTGELNTLWNMITEICEAGKIIGKARKDKAMVRDYTLHDQLKKVRQMRKREEEEG